MLIKALKSALLLLLPLSLASGDLANASLRLEARFEDGKVKEGFGFFINDQGYIITSAQNVYNTDNDLYATSITLKAQEIKNEPITCFVQAEAKAVDIDRNLALLRPKKSLDVFCHDYQGISDYFKSYVSEHHLDPFLNNDQECCPLVAAPNMEIFYPYLKNHTNIAINESKITALRDTIHEETRYTTDMDIQDTSMQDLSGAPVVDKASNFVGVLEYTNPLHSPAVLSKGVVVGWLCELDMNMVTDFNTVYKNETIKLHDHPICKEYAKERLYSLK